MYEFYVCLDCVCQIGLLKSRLGADFCMIYVYMWVCRDRVSLLICDLGYTYGATMRYCLE